MAYSQGLKTRFVEPVYHDGTTRTEFRLPPGVTYASNLRITNLGAVLPTATAASPANKLCGLLGGIRHIYFYQAGRLIDQRREFNRWAAFNMAYNQTNEYNTGLARSMVQCDWGYEIDGPTGNVYSAGPAAQFITDDPATTSTAVLYLKDVFSFLRSVDWLPDSLAPITIIIEWDLRTNTVCPVQDVQSFLQPTLVADYNESPKIATAAEKELSRDIAYNATVHDVAYVDGINPTAGGPFQVQQQSLRPRGMDGLNVQRLLVSAEPTAGLSDQVGRLASASRFRGTDRFVVNGAQLHGYEGLSTEARRLQVLSDTYGVVNSLPGLAQPTAVFAANHINAPNGLIGEVSYTGVPINETVRDLQYEWARTGVYNPGAAGAQTDELANRPLTLHFFGDTRRVRKANGDIFEV